MKHLFICTFAIGILVSSCTSTKTATSMFSPDALNGTWILEEIVGPEVGMDVLYPDKKPTITFDVANLKINGNTGCNNFNGPFTVNGATLDLSAPLGMTRMMCPGNGEAAFVSILQQSTGWTVREESLRLMTGDLVVMRLSKASK
jgi:heat shock protein HslJ